LCSAYFGWNNFQIMSKSPKLTRKSPKLLKKTPKSTRKSPIVFKKPPKHPILKKYLNQLQEFRLIIGKILLNLLKEVIFMWVKKLQIPIHVLQGEALLRRLLKNDPRRPEIEKDIRIQMKGYYGEKNFSYYLSFLPEEKYDIFQGLRLKDKKEFQMDVLILSQNFILIVEVKNISGTIKIN
jgi:hypothetical protein